MWQCRQKVQKTQNKWKDMDGGRPWEKQEKQLRGFWKQKAEKAKSKANSLK